MKALIPNSLPRPFGAYSHGVDSGGLITTSGQLALAADGTIPEGVQAQAELCFDHIAAILAEAGADLSHVLRFSAFVTRREDMAAYMAVRDARVAHLPVLPASTLMIVSGFTRPEFLVEVEALARLP
ncbi:RidA family protein [Salipiger marinus]|uniref:Enamine deaminase RidA, house cleaning of reactive enamine intermediates, YjgF/YER057c/UK114 family n=1 Tax=Salipiger marinus TaxID=555512 RepID=A0A1G8PBL8_9RHOB|nr:RidA family protein [Salipiger marinus]SDI89726.1 Enamine deaminase RidA, house cleaning of reactive enamine intermediates, YjgF/YER057c/UK114 family [Salipiger marinus]